MKIMVPFKDIQSPGGRSAYTIIKVLVYPAPACNPIEMSQIGIEKFWEVATLLSGKGLEYRSRRLFSRTTPSLF